MIAGWEGKDGGECKEVVVGSVNGGGVGWDVDVVVQTR